MALPTTDFDFEMVLYFPAQAAPSYAIMTSCAAVDGAPDPRPPLRPSELPVTSAPDHSFMLNGLAGFRRQVESRTLGRCVVGLSAGDAQKAQTAFYELLELDFRLACEVSGKELLLRCQLPLAANAL